MERRGFGKGRRRLSGEGEIGKVRSILWGDGTDREEGTGKTRGRLMAGRCSLGYRDGEKKRWRGESGVGE